MWAGPSGQAVSAAVPVPRARGRYGDGMSVCGQARTSSGSSGACPGQGGQDRAGVAVQPRGPAGCPGSAATTAPPR